MKLPHEPFAVLCPDGVDRLHTRWATREMAENDARYFSPRTSCFDWCDRDGDHACPGGTHYVHPPLEREEPEVFAWTVDLAENAA